MTTINKNLITPEEFKEKNYGKYGTKERDELEAGYENFKIRALKLDSRISNIVIDDNKTNSTDKHLK